MVSLQEWHRHLAELAVISAASGGSAASIVLAFARGASLGDILGFVGAFGGAVFTVASAVYIDRRCRDVESKESWRGLVGLLIDLRAGLDKLMADEEFWESDIDHPGQVAMFAMMLFRDLSVTPTMISRVGFPPPLERNFILVGSMVRLENDLHLAAGKFATNAQEITEVGWENANVGDMMSLQWITLVMISAHIDALLTLLGYDREGPSPIVTASIPGFPDGHPGNPYNSDSEQTINDQRQR